MIFLSPKSIRILVLWINLKATILLTFMHLEEHQCPKILKNSVLVILIFELVQVHQQNIKVVNKLKKSDPYKQLIELR